MIGSLTEEELQRIEKETFETGERVYLISEHTCPVKTLFSTPYPGDYYLCVMMSGVILLNEKGEDKYGVKRICKVTDQNAGMLRRITKGFVETHRQPGYLDWYPIIEGQAIVLNSYGFDDFFKERTGTRVDSVGYEVDYPNHYPAVVILREVSDNDDDYWVATSAALQNYTNAIAEYNKNL